MSELFDKEVNAQKEFEKGLKQVPTSPQKVCKNDACVKMSLVEGSTLWGAYENR